MDTPLPRGGDLIRFNLETGEWKPIRPWAPAFTELRLNRDAPIALDPHDPTAIYYGSQFVHKSVNRGETWQIISGDLTANDPARRREARRDGPEEEGRRHDHGHRPESARPRRDLGRARTKATFR